MWQRYNWGMTNPDWTAIAERLRELRAAIVAGWPSLDGHPSASHDRKLIHFSKLEMLDRVVVEIAAAIASRTPRFDRRRFVRMVGLTHS